MDKFDEKMNAAVATMGGLCGRPVQNSEEGVHDALRYVFCHGTYSDGAKAVMTMVKWMWAHCEKEYHSQTPSAK